MEEQNKGKAEVMLYIEQKCDEFGVSYDYALTVLKDAYPASTPSKQAITKMIKKIANSDTTDEQCTSTTTTATATTTTTTTTNDGAINVDRESVFIGNDPVTGEPMFKDLMR